MTIVCIVWSCKSLVYWITSRAYYRVELKTLQDHFRPMFTLKMNNFAIYFALVLNEVHEIEDMNMFENSHNSRIFSGIWTNRTENMNLCVVQKGANVLISNTIFISLVWLCITLDINCISIKFTRKSRTYAICFKFCFIFLIHIKLWLILFCFKWLESRSIKRSIYWSHFFKYVFWI